MLSNIPHYLSQLATCSFLLAQGKRVQFLAINLTLHRFDSIHTVRLQGSVTGRSAVCRDLDTDLKRIKGLGVRCIVWCASFPPEFDG